MIAFTPDARAYLEDYLADVRAAVVGHASLSPGEIEQDVRDHVAAALDGSSGPITAPQLAAVLERLGPPNQWVGDEPRSVWKYLTDKLKPVGHRAVEQIKALPGEAYQAGRGLVGRVRGLSPDWRLAYASIALFTLGIVAFPLMIASYFVARADLSLARERGESLGARRWLIYPPLVLVSVALGLVLMAWPILPAAAMSAEIDSKSLAGVSEMLNVKPRAVHAVTTIYLGVGFVSLWWGIVALTTLRFPKLPGSLLPPIGSMVRRIDAMILLFLSATVFVVWLSKAEVAWRVAQYMMWQT